MVEMNQFAQNFKKLFEVKEHLLLGVINDNQINYIFEKWEKYNLHFSVNRLHCFKIFDTLSFWSHNYILVFPDSNKIIQTNYNIILSMSLIKNIVCAQELSTGIKYDSVKFQPTYYNSILQKVCTGPTIIVVEMPLNSIILNILEIPEYIEKNNKNDNNAEVNNAEVNNAEVNNAEVNNAEVNNAELYVNLNDLVHNN